MCKSDPCIYSEKWNNTYDDLIWGNKSTSLVNYSFYNDSSLYEVVYKGLHGRSKTCYICHKCAHNEEILLNQLFLKLTRGWLEIEG